MLRISPISIFAGAGTIAASLCVSVPIASSGPLESTEGQTQYLPVQSISHQFGSKFMSGYFVQQGATCFVALMLIETNAPDAVSPASATRVRLVLYPGQIVGLDSEEGRSVNLTCGENATTMLLDTGERDRLVAQQSLALPSDVAKSH
jgi:hypothetical protein